MRKYLMLFLFSSCFSGLYSQPFTNITEQAGIQLQPAMGDLIVWLDYDNDGWLDFFGGTESEIFLFRNNGNGTFTNLIVGSGLESIFPRAVAVGDCDNDGYDDLLISSFHNSTPPKVYKNLNGQSFTEVFSTPDLNNSHRAIWLDFNADGLIDFVTSSLSGNTVLYLNKGNCQFEAASGFDPFNVGSLPVAGDFNNDGLQDIFVGIDNTIKTNRLYKNITGSNIQDITFNATISDFRKCVSAAWGDMDNNGFLDLYIGNIGSNRNVFFYNKGNSTFEDRTVSAGISDAGDARNCTWQDVNNDGWIDLFTTNHTATNKLYINNGNSTFTNKAPESNISGPADGFGVSWGDFDKDGDLDVLICGHSFAAVLLRNELNSNNSFLNIKLIGTHDNRSAIGARASLYSNGSMQIREVNGGQGATGQDALALHFGMGSQTLADSIIVKWPSGAIQKIFNISANQHLTIVQEGNIPPTRFRLISPSPDTVYQLQTLRFSWQASSDPDSSNPVQYQLRISSPDRDTLIGPITENFVWVNMQPWMSTEPCTWKVSASDGIDITSSWDEFLLHNDIETSLISIDQNPAEIFSIITWTLAPASHQLQLQLFSATQQSVVCSVFDFSGRSLLSLPLVLPPGTSIHNLPIDRQTGSVILSLQSGTKRICEKLMRLE